MQNNPFFQIHQSFENNIQIAVQIHYPLFYNPFQCVLNCLPCITTPLQMSFHWYLILETTKHSSNINSPNHNGFYAEVFADFSTHWNVR